MIPRAVATFKRYRHLLLSCGGFQTVLEILSVGVVYLHLAYALKGHSYFFWGLVCSLRWLESVYLFLFFCNYNTESRGVLGVHCTSAWDFLRSNPFFGLNLLHSA